MVESREKSFSFPLLIIFKWQEKYFHAVEYMCIVKWLKQAMCYSSSYTVILRGILMVFERYFNDSKSTPQVMF